MLVSRAFIGVDGADIVRYEGLRQRRDLGSLRHNQVDLGDFAVYNSNNGIGITYEVNEIY